MSRAVSTSLAPSRISLWQPSDSGEWIVVDRAYAYPGWESSYDVGVLDNQDGTYEIEVRYQLAVIRKDGEAAA